MENLHQKAITLIEILVVLAILAISIPLVLSYQKSRQNQVLNAEINKLKSNLETAQLYAREAKEKTSWSIQKLSQNEYRLTKGLCTNQETQQEVARYKLDSGISISNFSACFEIATGETLVKQTITLTNQNGITKSIVIYQTGLIEEVK